ncbi:MAG: hypothetical protein AAF645_01680 [Myxococcota bacterium]
MKPFAFPSLLILALGCGGAAPQTAAEPSAGGQTADVQSAGGEEASAEPTLSPGENDSFEALVNADAALADELATLNCRSARDLTDSICELAERVCELSDGSQPAVERCADGQGRCERARERVDERCPQ